MPTPTFKITAVESQLYEWDKPPIWNGMHVYDKGRLHLIKVTAKNKTNEIIGYGFNGGNRCDPSALHIPKVCRPVSSHFDRTRCNGYCLCLTVSQKLQNLWTRGLSHTSHRGDKPSVLGYPRENSREVCSYLTRWYAATHPHLYRWGLLWSREGV